MSKDRQWGRALAARSDKGTIAGDLERAEAEAMAAAEALSAANQRYRDLVGDAGLTDDPRAPWGELARFRLAADELRRLIGNYVKVVQKRGLGDRNRSGAATVGRLRRMMLAAESLAAMIPGEGPALAKLRGMVGRGIEEIENRGLPRKRP
jgi:hypothetical protein